LAEIDRRYGNDAPIVPYLSSDATYGEVLHDTFGKRVVGVQIGAHGDGSTFEIRRVRNGVIQVCLGRTPLFQTLLRECRSNTIRLPQGPMGKRAFQQLVDLEVQAKENRDIYKWLPGKHDDLAISCAILVWAPGIRVWGSGCALLKTDTGRARGGRKETRGKPLFDDPSRWCGAALTPPNQILPRGHSSLLEYLPLRLPRLATAAMGRARAIRSQRLRFGAAAGRSRAPRTDVGLFNPCRKEGQPPAASFAITNRDHGNFY
jgi:hypothetical protein